MKPILELHQISKRYQIRHQQENYLSLRERIVDAFRFNKNKPEPFWAVKDVSFHVQPGESLGIIGRNGAGKSTLLKILSRITPPTEGKIIARGRVASLLEVGTGFHQELTGRENIFFNGSLLGMKRKEIEAKFDEIVDFSGVENFLDTSLKHYSSGMQLRLAFAVAAFLEPEILVIDEVLAVGDSEFQKKCMGKMEDVTKSGRTILFVSHDLNAVSSLCSRSILLANGKVAFNGDSLECISCYENKMESSVIFTKSSKNSHFPVFFKSIKLSGSDGHFKATFLYSEPIIINFELEIVDLSFRCDLFVMILDSRKRRLFACESSSIKECMKLFLPANTLVRGTYSIHAFINQPNMGCFDEAEDVCSFEILDNGSPMLKHGSYDYGGVFINYKWSFDK